VICDDVNGFFRVRVSCEHLTSGRHLNVYGPWTFHDGSSTATCGSGYRVSLVRVEF